MADPVVLQQNVPFETKTPTLQVAGLKKPGVYLFELVVTDEIGLVSKPAQVTVTVRPG